MPRSKQTQPLLDLGQEGADALVAATFAFLRRNKISGTVIAELAHKHSTAPRRNRSRRPYSAKIRSYEDMGELMATWFSDPRFLDESGHPLPLSEGKGTKSIAHLVRAAQVSVNESSARALLRQSPSVTVDGEGNFVALRRVFVLPGFEIPRAALLVERYLDTLQRNASERKSETIRLLERSCHVSKIDLANIAPILRDVKARGAAFMDSIDGDLEGRRLATSKRKNVGEMGVLVFAWTRPDGGASGPRRKPTPARAGRKAR